MRLDKGVLGQGMVGGHQQRVLLKFCRHTRYAELAAKDRCQGEPLHCVRYFLDQDPPEESPSTPLPNALASPLPQEQVPL